MHNALRSWLHFVSLSSICFFRSTSITFLAALLVVLDTIFSTFISLDVEAIAAPSSTTLSQLITKRHILRCALYVFIEYTVV